MKQINQSELAWNSNERDDGWQLSATPDSFIYLFIFTFDFLINSGIYCVC